MIRGVVFALAALSSGCLSPLDSHGARQYPAWAGASRMVARSGCAELEAWVAKSGKEGVGVTFALRDAGGGRCDVALAAPVLRVGGEAHAPMRPVAERFSLGADAKVYLYVAFAFDNERAWNDGENDGELAVVLQGERVAWPIRQRTPARFPCVGSR